MVLDTLLAAAQLVIGANQSAGRVVVFDGAENAESAFLWTWSAAADPILTQEDADVGRWGLDECKLREQGGTLLVTGYGWFGAVDVETGLAKSFFRTDGNPHSIELLPDGRLAVADSSSLGFILADASEPFFHTRQTVKSAFPTSGAHGVEWDASRGCLWGLAYTNLYRFAYDPKTLTLKPLAVYDYTAAGCGDAFGHDLVPDGRGGYFITNHDGVWRFDPDAERFAAVSPRRNVKSYSPLAGVGALYQLPREKWWSDRIVLEAEGGGTRELGPFHGSRFYKARWTAPMGRETFPAMPDPYALRREGHDRSVRLPVFAPDEWAFKKGYRPLGVRAMECSVKGALVGSSVRIVDASGRELVRDVDWRLDEEWGVVGLAGGADVRQPVDIRYEFRLRRIDSLVVRANGVEEVRKGFPHLATPRPPRLADGEWLVENRLVSETGTEVFPFAESPALAPRTPEGARKTLPAFMAKLDRGEAVTILAWGDSVTDCVFLPEKHKWQRQFVERLRKAYPKSEITLLENAWGGRTTKAYLAEPAGSAHSYEETVLAARCDLVISEFVNDAGLSEEDFTSIYPKILADFRAAGREWVILTPHYVRPDWMGLDSSRDCADDPRAYVRFLRSFAAENGVGLADAALRWGHLHLEGVPHETMFLNAINHPVPDGMGYYVDALLDFFGIDRQKEDRK